MDSDIWNTDKSVCATEAIFHAVAQMNCLKKQELFVVQVLESQEHTLSQKFSWT
jgi:hypothetical protein